MGVYELTQSTWILNEFHMLIISCSWCAFLDNLTEELEEEDNPSIYEDYKFISREELNELGAFDTTLDSFFLTFL